MTILISKFDNGSQEQFMNTDMSMMGSQKKMHTLMENDIVLAYNYESNAIFGIARISVFEDNRIIRENPISNVHGLYEGKYNKYSKYEVAIKNFHLFQMDFDKLIKTLKMNSKVHNNIVKNSNTGSFTKIYYSSLNEDENKRIIDTITLIVETAFENIEVNSKILNDKITTLQNDLKYKIDIA